MSRKRKLDGDSPDVPSIAESWSRTEQYTVKGRHQWTIDNFLHRAQFTEVGDSLCSPIFGVPVEVIGSPKPSELLFQLEVFPNGEQIRIATVVGNLTKHFTIFCRRRRRR